jgi:formamidopyrimidine-DNA glycosylase
MPELPEVETVRRRLLACLPGLLVRDILVNDATVSEQSEAELRALLAGRRVVGLRRRGKYLIVDLGGVESEPGGTPARGVGVPRARASAPRPGAGPTIAVIHLRMTGQLLFSPASADRPPRFVWRLEPQTELAFQDVRRFGRLWAFEPAAEDEFFAFMGPEPFGDAFSVAYLRRALEGRGAPLKSFLLDQRRVAGVGNIYADEALFRARLHPLRAAGSVGGREALRLHAALLETLQAGIDHEGSSIESFIDPAGRRGSFQEILNVYQRTGEPCGVCGATIQRLEVGGRGTHYCPACQPRRGGMARGSRRQRGSSVPPRGGTPPAGASPGG